MAVTLLNADRDRGDNNRAYNYGRGGWLSANREEAHEQAVRMASEDAEKIMAAAELSRR